MRTLGLGLILCSLVLAGDRPGRAPAWKASWDEAVEEGRVLNLPVVVHRHGFY